MIDESPPPRSESEPSDVRFSTRALLIVTVVVAVVAAALRPYFHSLTADERPLVGAMWGICLTIAVAKLGYQARLRYGLERTAGKRIVSLSPHSKKLRRANSWFAYVGGGLMITCGVLYLFGENFAFHLRQNRPNASAYLVLAIVMRACLSGIFIAFGIATIWWSRAVQLREHGVLHGLRLLQWDHVTNCHWSRWTKSVSLEGVDQHHRDYQVGISIPSRQLEAVGDILTEKLPALFDAQQIHTLSYRSTRPTPFPIVTPREHFSRGCLVFLIAWIGGITIASFFGRAQTQEFGTGWVAGALASCGAAYVSSRKTAQAGRPLMRLGIWFDWPAVMGWAIVAGLCYALGRVFALSSVWISIPLGLVCGYAFVSVVRVMARDKLDLCEHGIVVRRAWFWPWQGTHARFSDSETYGRIEFRRGWRRIASIVSSAQCEAIQTLLREKLVQEKESQMTSNLHRSGSFSLMLLLLAGITGITQDNTSSALEWIRVSDDGTHFVRGHSAERFVVWGVNYDHDRDGRLLEDYWHDEWPTVVEDFHEIKQLNANTVRVHLQLGKFMEAVGRPHAANLERLAELVRLAEQTGLYLDVTGLGCYHKQDVPPWYSELSEAERWKVQQQFWRAVANVCKASPAIFCYDLMNEPVLPGNKPETEWLAGELGGKFFVQRIALDLAGRTRTEVAKDWVAGLTSAIRDVDDRHLITVGEIPWATVFKGAKSTFHAAEVGGSLDFVSVHFYPKRNEVAEALAALRVYEIGKPLVVEEIFPLQASIEETAEFIDASRDIADGWISFYWGETIEESRRGTEIQHAIMVKWLEHFQSINESKDE